MIKILSTIWVNKIRILVVILVILLASVSALLYTQIDQNTQLSNTLSETKDKYDALTSSFKDLTNQFDKFKADTIRQNLTATNNYKKLKAQYDNLQANYSTLKGQYNDLKTSYNDITSKYDNLQITYDNTKSSYAELQISYNNLKKQYDTLQSSFNGSQSSYAQLLASYNNLQTSFNSLQSQYNDQKMIVELKKNIVLDYNKTIVFLSNGTFILSYKTNYTGFITINFNSTQYIFFKISSDYTNTDYIRYPLENAVNTGVFKIPVFPGITRISIRNTNYFYDATVRYTITYIF
jgi:archaellum component FlaC